MFACKLPRAARRAAAQYPIQPKVQRRPNLTILKTDGTLTAVAGSPLTYTINYTVTLASLGPADAAGTVVTDPAAGGLSCAAVSCTSTAANMCPPVFALQGAGLQVTPAFPANSTASCVLTCAVIATGE